MPPLTLSGRPVGSLFELVGHGERGLTDGLGWVLANVATFRAAVAFSATGQAVTPNAEDKWAIALQDGHESGGFTDVELRFPGKFHIIIEAKQGWGVPDVEQLGRYRKRFAGEPCQTLVVLTQATKEFAQQSGMPAHIAGIHVCHMRWSELMGLARASRAASTNAEKALLDQFVNHLREKTEMRSIYSNLVYVVALSPQIPAGGQLSFIDIVRQRGVYFHPYGKGWPKEPPTYLGVRYDGRLQSIHYVEDYEIIKDLYARFPEGGTEPGDRFFYKLGPAIIPQQPVLSGKLWNRRVYAMLDTLLTASTIEEAVELTKKRVSAAPSA